MSGRRLGSSSRIGCCARLKHPISTPNRPSRAFPAPLWPPQYPIDATGMRTPQKHSALLSTSTKQIKRLLPRNVGAAVPEGPLYGIRLPKHPTRATVWNLCASHPHSIAQILPPSSGFAHPGGEFYHQAGKKRPSQYWQAPIPRPAGRCLLVQEEGM